ncbi:hypothetical protein [Pelagovum pacificum]|uniref:Uncharacterized protein n=1 Tax=Pelagovum pacificum TaxID=2588711 RepID=A0A5C5GCM9_9RHOB|nr:hypothetical protein [Pelagovum pacificum]QQA44326.1 hypothetical protein I8N54_07070 [Pelagovum pacificum]TNY32555.1 hypothetical protein FHY64_04505 [Pelagovum pacificum]
MGFFTGLDANDHEGHFNALSKMVEAVHGVEIPPTHKRAESWHEAETFFNAPIGQEVRSFLGFITDVVASGHFETLVGDKGKMKPTDPCQYHLELKNLNEIDPFFEGISYMENYQSRSYYSILTSHQAQSPCPTASYTLRKYKGKHELARGPYGDVSLISFALRFYGQRSAKEGRSLSSTSLDAEAFHAEACRCFGKPADLGEGVYFFEADNAEILIRPLADIGVHLSVFDLHKPSPVSDELLRLLDGGMATFKA